MRKPITETIQIPEGLECNYTDGSLKCKKGSDELSKILDSPQIEIKIANNEISVFCKKANKIQYKIIKSYIAHIQNVFRGLEEKFTYHLESVNVHFPMSLKIQGNKMIISNFFGEKKNREAKISPGVEVKIEGQKITITSTNKEAAGQTAANLEKATKVKGRDNRIYQDGIYIVEKPKRSSFAAEKKATAERGASQQERIEENRGGGE